MYLKHCSINLNLTLGYYYIVTYIGNNNNEKIKTVLITDPYILIRKIEKYNDNYYKSIVLSVFKIYET